MSKYDKEKVLKIRIGGNGGKKSSKPGGCYKSGRDGNSGKWKSKIANLENKVNKQKRHFSVFNTADNYGLDNKKSDDPEKEYGNSKHSDLTRQESLFQTFQEGVAWESSIY